LIARSEGTRHQRIWRNVLHSKTSEIGRYTHVLHYIEAKAPTAIQHLYRKPTHLLSIDRKPHWRRIQGLRFIKTSALRISFPSEFGEFTEIWVTFDLESLSTVKRSRFMIDKWVMQFQFMTLIQLKSCNFRSRTLFLYLATLHRLDYISFEH